MASSVPERDADVMFFSDMVAAKRLSHIFLGVPSDAPKLGVCMALRGISFTHMIRPQMRTHDAVLFERRRSA